MNRASSLEMEQAYYMARYMAAELAINTEVDLLNELKKQLHLNDIPLTVKKHFKLE